MPEVLTKPVPHDDAKKFIAEKPTVSREVFDQLLPDVQARAFTIKGVEDATVAQNVRDRIAELPAGADWAQVKIEIADKISPWLGDGAERRAETLMRMHGYQAYSVAQHEVMSRQRAAFPFWQYQSSDDSTVRDTHEALNGIVLPADSPFWDSHYPPWEWGCRCQVVPLMQEDVDDMIAADAGKKPEERRVLDAAAQRDLLKNGTLTRALPGDNGVPRRYNVTRVEREGSYRFDPSSLQMDAQALSQRYDPEVWKNFESYAQRTKLDDGRTVIDWLNASKQSTPVSRTQIPPPPAAPVPTPAPKAQPAPATPKPVTPPPVAPATIPSTPTPAPAPAPTPAPKPKVTATVPPVVPPAAPVSVPALPGAPVVRKAPVSNALKNQATGTHRQQIETAIKAIDAVHDDGALPSISIVGTVGNSSSLGVYRFYKNGKADGIGIKNQPQSWPALTAAHEIGHFLDHQVLGRAGEFASAAHPALAGFRTAVGNSSAAKAIAQLSAPERRYFASAHEMWARAYAQYIATRSGDPVLLAHLDKIRAGAQPWRQWSDADFAPIADTIDELFKTKGWRT